MFLPFPRLTFNLLFTFQISLYDSLTNSCSDREDQPHIQGAVAAQAQEGLEELSHIEGQEGQWWGDTPRPSKGAVAVLCWSIYEEIPHVQGKRNPSKTVGVAREHQRADTLKPYSQKTSQSNHTRTTALSNSMKLSHALWGHPRRVGHGGDIWQNVVHWRREWLTTSVFLPWEPHEQYEKAKW